jgi:hypothetical protein
MTHHGLPYYGPADFSDYDKEVMNANRSERIQPSVQVMTEAVVPTRSPNRERCFIALLFIVIAIVPNCFGSTVIVLIRDNNVWMAADSMLGSISGKPRYACKISQGTGFYWAAASPIHEELATGFNLKAWVGNVQASRGTLLQKMDAFIRKSKIPITAELERRRAVDRTSFQALLKAANHDLIKIIFVGVENHVPTVVWATIIAEETSGRIVVSVDTLKSIIPAEVRDGVVGAGFTTDAFNYLAQHHWETVTDPVSLLRESLRAAEKANPKDVGGTPSIITFTEKGEHWIDEGVCKQNVQK